MKRSSLLFTVPFLTLLIGACGPSERFPAEPSNNTVHIFDLEAVAASNAAVARFESDSPLGAPALHLESNLQNRSIVLVAPGDSIPWEEAEYLVADVLHADSSSDIFTIHFHTEEDPDEPRISSKMGVLPHLRTRLVLPLSYLDGQTFFMAREPRQLKGVMPGHRLPLDRIASVSISLEPVGDGFSPALWITDLRLTREHPASLPPGEPVVDSLGQWMARDWPGKTRSSAELVTQLNDLHERVADASFPDEWSRFGGWKQKSFRATGFFRTEHDGQRWWLVDPEGYAFYSIGVDVMNPESSGPYRGMEDLFTWLPPREGPMAAAYSGRSDRETVSFLTTNLIRAFGESWEQSWQETTRGLLAEWRFNTVGNWSDLDFARAAGLPYVLPLSGFPTTEVALYRDFPDVFSEEYREASERFAEQMAGYREDPYLIGYFLRNEPLWAFGNNNIASEMLASEVHSQTRRRFASWLSEVYGGDVASLSAAWNHSFGSFEDLVTAPILDAAELSERAGRDLWQFSELMVDEYLRIPSEALRRVDPDHMNLGIRYASISSDLCYRGSEFFDVFSINAYVDRPDADHIGEIVRRTGKPVMIGEFHHGAIDRGLPSTGIRGARSQEDRGIAYRYYVEQGASIPGLVGTHYFQLNDQPILGRFDGENYNIGLVDICNRPHEELVDAATETNARIYSVASGQVRPFDRTPARAQAIYF